MKTAPDVSRETERRLATYAGLLRHWTRRINLVAPSTIAELERRHIADSAQLWPLAPPTARAWLDLGSGAGLPGLVIAALAAEEAPGLRIALVEADQRKVAFLQTAAHAMSLEIEILATRIEALPPRPFDVISARALAPLPRLLALAVPFVHPGSVLLFPKGADVDAELGEAATNWRYECDRIRSQTDPDGTVLRLTGLARR